MPIQMTGIDIIKYSDEELWYKILEHIARHLIHDIIICIRKIYFIKDRISDISHKFYFISSLQEKFIQKCRSSRLPFCSRNSYDFSDIIFKKYLSLRDKFGSMMSQFLMKRRNPRSFDNNIKISQSIEVSRSAECISVKSIWETNRLCIENGNIHYSLFLEKTKGTLTFFSKSKNCNFFML